MNPNGPTSSVVVMPRGDYSPNGTRAIAQMAIASDAVEVQWQFDGLNMTDPALVVDVMLDLSLDGGVTWASESPSRRTNPFPIAASFRGGSVDKAGDPVDVYLLANRGDLPQGDRRVRAFVTVHQGRTLTTEARIVVI